MSDERAPSTEPSSTGSASSNRSLMLVLSYLGILAVVPLLAEKEDREVQWHAKHGLVLFGAWLVLMVGTRVLLAVLYSIVNMGCVGFLIRFALPIPGLAYLALAIVCMIKALNGQRLLIPGLSPLVDKF